MIHLDSVLQIHEEAIKKYGGINGIRDQNSLESAINRPFQTFDSEDLYPTPEEKACAILESIVKNHPFLDGNKRTGYILMRLILLQNGLDIKASQEEKYTFVIQLASGVSTYESCLTWIKSHLVKA